MATTGSTGIVIQLTTEGSKYEPTGGFYCSFIRYVGTTANLNGDDQVVSDSTAAGAVELFRSIASGGSHVDVQKVGAHVSGVVATTLTGNRGKFLIYRGGHSV